MECTQLNKKIQKRLDDLLSSNVKKILDAIAKEGGVSYLVGGAVRDLLLGIQTKDLDIEIHKLSLEELEKVLRQFGHVELIGKAFGVLRVHPMHIDWSVPRVDEPGRKPNVLIDPNLDIKTACERRDITMNAMAINLLTNELCDPFGGQEDMKKGILRAPNPKKFIEDPLRFFRVLQFMARFGMLPDEELKDLCKKVDISEVSRERIEDEFRKWLVQSPKPSIALDWLDSIGRLREILPEVKDLQGVPQQQEWHPEGDVYEHTKQAVDAAAQLEYPSDNHKLLMMYAALCHDLGKAISTKKKDGKIVSYGHEDESEKLAKKMLGRLTHNKELIKRVAKLCRYHMHPGSFVKSGAKLSAYKRLADKLSPELTMEQLAQLFLIDRLARNPKRGEPLKGSHPDVDKFLEKVHKANVFQKKEEPVLHGRDLMPDIEPGLEMGKLLKKAYKIQLDTGIKDKAELKKRVLRKT